MTIIADVQYRRSQDPSLPQLIDRALAGKEVVITRHGCPVVTLKPVAPPPRRITEAHIEWLRAHRVGRKSGIDAVTLVRQIGDERC